MPFIIRDLEFEMGAEDVLMTPRLVLVGDPRQLQAVGRGGMFNELVAGSSRTHQLETIHRFNYPWEAAASLRLRSCDPSVLEVYEAKGRIIPGSPALRNVLTIPGLPKRMPNL